MPFSTRQLTQLLRRVGTQLEAGVDMRWIWAKEAERAPSGQQQALEQISRRVATGDSLAEALAACPGMFPPLVCELVDVGERMGRLDEVLLRLAEHYEHLLQLRRTFLIGITWPMLQLGVAVLVVGLLIWVLGAIAPMTGGEPVDILGFGLTGTRGLLIYIGLLGALAGGMALLIVALRRGWLGAHRLLPLVMRLPGIGSYLQTMSLARMSWTLGLALDSGVDARHSMRMALRSTQSPVYTAHLEEVDRIILNGGEFHQALRQSGVFPAEFLNALETAEVSGTHGDSLQRLSSEYQERAKSSSMALTVLASMATWGFVAAILILLIFRLAMFYLGTINEALEGF